jgi:hypothetical protein
MTIQKTGVQKNYDLVKSLPTGRTGVGHHPEHADKTGFLTEHEMTKRAYFDLL